MLWITVQGSFCFALSPFFFSFFLFLRKRCVELERAGGGRQPGVVAGLGICHRKTDLRLCVRFGGDKGLKKKIFFLCQQKKTNFLSFLVIACLLLYPSSTVHGSIVFVLIICLFVDFFVSLYLDWSASFVCLLSFRNAVCGQLLHWLCLRLGLCLLDHSHV